MHFTYAGSVDCSTLKQGDILTKTDELKRLLSKVHPHYARDEYTHFQVLTQSCDLVRRNDNKCSSRYISLAAIRDLDTVIKRMIESDVDSKKQLDIEGKKFCSDKFKQRVSQKLNSLLNNNDKNHFFLKAEPNNGLINDLCTFLHLSIAIRAYEHYDLCLEAKKIELDSNFQAKLGWLVGNLYSRVGTEDQVPRCFSTDKDFESYIQQILDEHVMWVKHNLYAGFKKLYSENNNKGVNYLLKLAEKENNEKFENKVKTFVGMVNQNVELSPEQSKKLQSFLLNNSAGRNFIKA